MYNFKEIYDEYNSKLNVISKESFWDNRIELYYNDSSKEIIEDFCSKFNIYRDMYETFIIIGTINDIRIINTGVNDIVLEYTCNSGGDEEKLYLYKKEQFYFRDNAFVLKGKRAIFFLIFENSFLLGKLNFQLTI